MMFARDMPIFLAPNRKIFSAGSRYVGDILQIQAFIYVFRLQASRKDFYGIPTRSFPNTARLELALTSLPLDGHLNGRLNERTR